MPSTDYDIEIKVWDESIHKVIVENNPTIARLIAAGMSSEDQVMFAEYAFADNILKLGKLNLPLKNGDTAQYDPVNADETLRHFMGNDLMLPFGLILQGYVETSSDSGERIFPLGWGTSGSMLGTRNFYKATQYNFATTGDEPRVTTKGGELRVSPLETPWLCARGKPRGIHL